MANIINAIMNLVENPKFDLNNYSKSYNRANNMGGALEEYIKDIFAGTVDEKDENVRDRELSKVFSYLGNHNNPPDAMLRGGAAIEVKKIESKGSSLALNSSYPKAKFYADSTMITKTCKNCEDWEIKDMIYAVGIVDSENLKSLALVYGEDYCADKSVYENTKKTIKNGVENISGIDFTETNELGKVNRVDPLGITYLRVRGMWGIENPFTVFRNIYKPDYSKEFNFMAIINKEKYDSYNNHSKLEQLCSSIKDLEIKDVKIKNPNNPAQLKEAKLIKFTV